MRSSSFYSSATVALALLTLSGISAAQAPAKAAAPLPLKNVRLYEAGVGYFERSGKVGNTSGLSLPVPPSHLDDALKTLVVLGTDGKTTVSGIEFGSSISAEMGRALAGLPQGDTTITYAGLLRSLKGGSVDLRTAHESVRGRVVDVLDPENAEPGPCLATATAGGAKPEGAEAAAPVRCVQGRETTLLLLTEQSEIRRFRTSEIVGVKPTNAGLASRLGAGLDAVGPQGAARDLRVLAQSSGDVTLGYVAEAPLWRSTYRMVLDGTADRGTLQGWALIHNDTDEEWRKVHVDLVNGRPDSFLFPLAAPRYTRRELVTPPEPLPSVPQLLGQTPDAMWDATISDSFGVGGLGLSGVGEGGGGRGEGIGLGSIGTIGHGSGTGSAGAGSTVLSVGDLAAVAQAEGLESGALFRYSIAAPVDLRPHGSALVPFLQQSIAARRIVYFDSPGVTGRSAARIKNDTKQTLPAGTIAFFEAGGFAGEAQLDRMKPGDSKIIAFGTDIDVEADLTLDAPSEETQLVEADGDKLIEHFIRHHRFDYEIRNKSGGPRVVFVGLSLVRNATVKGTDALDFDLTLNKPLAVFNIEPRTQKARQVEADEGLARTHAIDALGASDLRRMAESTKLSAKQRAGLLEAARALVEAEARRSVVPVRRAELDELTSDLARLRGYLGATKSEDEAEKFVKRILEKEDRIKALRVDIGKLEGEAKAQKEKARAALLKLSR